MIYIHQVGSINYKETQLVDIKAQCKLIAPKFIRRTDQFIQLAILGVEQIKRNTKIDANCALYLTSGQGNIGVFQRLCEQNFIDKMPPKPVDFINSLSNTAGFYVSQFLNLESKNSNLSHLCFVVEMALLLAKSDLLLNKEESILLGGVDQLLPSPALSRAALGLSNDDQLGQGSNWVLLKKNRESALASIDLTNREMNKQQLLAYLAMLPNDSPIQLGFSVLIEPADIREIVKESAYQQYHYQAEVGFYETMALYVINRFVVNEKGRLFFIDYFSNKYRIIEVEVCETS